MLGTLRLLLALAVALSHAGLTLGSLHIGVPAVIVFYVLAGYVVAKQCQGFRDSLRLSKLLPAFYVDRALRLLPTYAVALAIGAAIAIVAKPDSPFLMRAPDALCVFSNLTIVPLNFFMFTGVDQCTLIPVAWSLGLEIQFYALAPILARNVDARRLLGSLSLGVYVAAVAGYIHTDVWGYRLLPGTLFIFILGIELAESSASRALTSTHWWICGLVFGVALLLVVNSPALHRDFAIETSVGLLISVPLVRLLEGMARTPQDDWAGAISYPLFLVHFPILWTLEAFRHTWNLPGSLFSYVFLALACASLMAALIDRPITRLRRRLRANWGNASL